MIRPLIAAAVCAMAVTSAVGAQQYQAEIHGEYARTTQTHTSSGGAGVQLQAVWGSSNAPVKLGTTLGGDWLKQEAGGPSQWSLGYDATLQFGTGAVTPYAGGSISANWFTGGDSPSGTLAGLQYIVGVQIKSSANSKSAITAEVRPGYVRTQEHTVTFRLGYAHQM